jgi:uncharacterized membrane protein YkvA (DUF1232 family)
MEDDKVIHSEFEDKYSDKGFWTKVKKYAKIAGKKLLKIALTLYYTMHDKDTPKWAKAIIIAALAYFIMPADAIPDLLPGGYVDDLGVLAAATAFVGVSIKPEHKKKAEEKLKQWFD